MLLGMFAFCMASPLCAENIAFADQTVKSLCVSNWDTDSDGELSIEEAVAVTSLGAVFRENRNINSFEELRFFTGLTAIDDSAFYKSSITKVVFPTTVTAIGAFAFCGSGISGDVTIPGTVKTIGNNAFHSCQQLERVFVEEGVLKIENSAFSGPITLLSLPSSLTYLGSSIVDPYVNADPGSGMFVPKGDLYVKVRATTPTPIHDFAFFYVFGTSHLIVPAGCVDAYKAVKGWSHFGEYIEYALPSVSLTIGSTGYATLYYADKALEVPEGVEAYVVTQQDIDGDFVGWTASYTAGDVIPAGEAVVVKGVPGTFEFVEAAAVEERADGNLLQGYDSGTDLSATTTAAGSGDYRFYMLSTDGGGDNVGFYFANEAGGAFLCDDHKAYLALPAFSAVRAYPFIINNVTLGVDDGRVSVESPQSAWSLFSLSGSRLSGRSVKKGIYILRPAEGRLHGRMGRKEVMR